MRCQAIVRRWRRCQKPGVLIADLDMVLCPRCEPNERALRALGLSGMEPL